MKLLVLNIKENSELLRELNREYVTENFIVQIEDIVNLLVDELNLDFNMIYTSNLNGELYKAFIFVIDKIFLDNVFKYIALRNINIFIHLINNNTFNMDLYVNPFYTKQITDIVLKYINANEEDIYSITNIINNKLSEIINNIYMNNNRFLNPVLLNLFNSLHDSLGYINIKYYKFELDQFNRPMLIYSEKETNAFIHSQ